MRKQRKLSDYLGIRMPLEQSEKVMLLVAHINRSPTDENWNWTRGNLRSATVSAIIREALNNLLETYADCIEEERAKQARGE